MEAWFCLEQILNSVSLNEDTDSLIWQHESNGIYSSSSLYSIINFRGVVPVFIPSVWKIISPSRVNIFLWLLANNKLMTKYNLKKRGIEKPPECLFCSENESIQHLFFDCVVAKQIWKHVSDFFCLSVGSDYMSIAHFWPGHSKHACLNSVAAYVLWCIWKLRNDHVFNNAIWTDFK